MPLSSTVPDRDGAEAYLRIRALQSLASRQTADVKTVPPTTERGIAELLEAIESYRKPHLRWHGAELARSAGVMLCHKGFQLLMATPLRSGSAELPNAIHILCEITEVGKRA